VELINYKPFEIMKTTHAYFITFSIFLFSCKKDIQIKTTSSVSPSISQVSIPTGSVLLSAQASAKLYSYNASSGTVNWIYDGGADFFIGVPAVTDSIAYIKGISSSNNSIYLHAVNINTGLARWVKKIGRPNVDQSSPVVTKDNIVYVTTGPIVISLNASNGVEIWRWNANTGKDNNFSDPAFVNGSLYLASQSKYIYSINATTGALKWSYFDNNLTTNPVTSPCIRDGLLFYKNFTDLVCLDTNGNRKWTAPAMYGSGSPTYNNGVAYIQSTAYYFNQPKKSTVSGMNAITGQVTWRYDTDSINYGLRGNIFYKSNKIFLTLKDSLLAIDVATGKKLWSFYTGVAPDLSAPGSSEACGSGNVVYIAGLNRKLYAIDVASGKEIWSVNYGNGYYGDDATPVLINTSGAIHPTVSGMTQ
jgi:eukaryotic-like serine/threonine-protein kinase